MSEKNIKLQVLLCMTVHFTCIFTRLNLSINLTEIINSHYLSEITASHILNAGLLGFGAGQLISGIIGDRFNPAKVILAGLLSTSVTNILFILPLNFFVRLIVWFLNGLVCSFLWPPLIKFMSLIFTEKEYKDNSFLISLGSSLGSVTLYIISPLLIKFLNWQAVFIVTGSFCFTVGIIWYLKNCDFDYKKEKVSPAKNVVPTSLFWLFFALIICMILHGGIRDYIISWFPYYLTDKFGILSENSILYCILFPLFSVFCYKFISVLNRRMIKNELTCTVLLFTLTAATLIILSFTNLQFVSVICAGLSSGFADSINFLLTCIVPPYFKNLGKVSSVSGFLNTFTYLGVPVFSLFALDLVTAQNYSLMFLIMSLLSVFGGLLLSFAAKDFSKIKSGR